jgi:hypothetical protein
MTTAAPSSLPTDAPTRTVFSRAVTAEWTRLWTLRSTWWALLAGAALMLFIGAAAGSDHNGVDPAPIWRAAQFAIVPGQFAFLLVVLLAVTGEYSTGAIRSSLQWVPRRGILLAARTLVPVVFAVACAVVVAAATDLVAWGFLGQAAEVVPGDIAASLGRIALVVAFGSVLTVGLGLLLRSTAGTLTAIFLLMFALPVALGNTGVRWLIAISDRLPGRAIVSMIVVDQVELAASAVATVMITWTAAAVFAGGSSLIRRDST